LISFIKENGFSRGHINTTHFIKSSQYDMFIIQVNVDDIIFRSTNENMCKGFSYLMQNKFEPRSMMREFFFLANQAIN